MDLTLPPTIDEIIGEIRWRDHGSRRRPTDPLRWDTALANEIERLRQRVIDLEQAARA